MELPAERLRVLELLADELMKDEPTESLVVEYLHQAGLQDAKDPIGRINQVLMALHFSEPGKEFNE
jgi:hypothetical protein